MLPDFKYEREAWLKGFKFVAGADEVGRGALAGPLVAGAVVFEKARIFAPMQGDPLINDSKKLSPRQREEATGWIKKNALAWGVGEVSVSFINKYGIVKATQRAFREAVRGCNRRLGEDREIDFLLVDAFYVPYTRGLRRKYQLPVIKGDEKSISIAAASIVAKVYRDSLMAKLAGGPLAKYGWEKNKGYGTRDHQEAIRKYGIVQLHRKSFVSKLQPAGL